MLSTNNIMRQIVTILDVPVKVVLIVMLIISLIMVGGLIAEWIQRRSLTVKAASVIDAIKKGKNTLLNTVEDGIDDVLTDQVEAVEKIDGYVEKWKKKIKKEQIRL